MSKKPVVIDLKPGDWAVVSQDGDAPPQAKSARSKEPPTLLGYMFETPPERGQPVLSPYWWATLVGVIFITVAGLITTSTIHTVIGNVIVCPAARYFDPDSVKTASSLRDCSR
jgi:hypothetical protein